MRKSWKEYRDNARARFAANPEEFNLIHGSVNTYEYYGCHCDECKAAKSVKNRKGPEAKRLAKKGIGIRPIEMAYADYPTPVAKEVVDGMDDDVIRAKLFNQVDIQHISETFGLALTKYMESGNPEVLPPVFKTMRKNIIEGRA